MAAKFFVIWISREWLQTTYKKLSRGPFRDKVKFLVWTFFQTADIVKIFRRDLQSPVWKRHFADFGAALWVTNMAAGK